VAPIQAQNVSFVFPTVRLPAPTPTIQTWHRL
jgi:hypothetical protein